MTTLSAVLTAHPSSPCDAIRRLEAGLETAKVPGELGIRFRMVGDISRIRLPPAELARRRDGLWQHTCFEVFLRPDGSDAYHEFNFAPSGDWAAYDFTAHREGRADADVSAPYIRVEDNMTWWALGATIPVDAGRQWQLGLSAILEERDGTKSYWALAHPAGDKPDFHDPACFTAHLP